MYSASLLTCFRKALTYEGLEHLNRLDSIEYVIHKTNAMNLLKQASNLRVPSSLKYDEANKYSEDFLN